MALLIKSDGEVQEVHPADGNKFSLQELQGFVGGWIEHIPTNDGRHMWLDEEGKLKSKPVNFEATLFALGIIGPDDCIVGDALITEGHEVD